MSGADSVDFESLFNTEEGIGDQIATLWLEWNAAKQPIKNLWNEITQYIYATSTLDTINGQVGGTTDISIDEQNEGWGHTTHIPHLTNIFDSLTANYLATTMPHENFFTYEGEDVASSNQLIRSKIESYIKTKHRNSKFRTTYKKLCNDFVHYGNTIAQVVFEKDNVPSVIGGNTRGYVGPKVIRISPWDINFNPLASSFKRSPKIIRSLKTMGELLREVEDRPDSPFDMEAINRIKHLRSIFRQANIEDFDKYTQLQFDGFGSASQYFKSGYVEILDFYGDIYDYETDTFYKNHWITVADRTFVIQRSTTPTWDGAPLIFHAGWRERPDNLWAMGPLDNLSGIQYLINHLENARADAFDQMIEPTRVLVGSVEFIDDVESGKPGGYYRVPEAEGDVKNLLPDTTVLNADLQIENKMNQMDRYAGFPREELGFRTPGEKTLGEVEHLSEGASKLFKNKSIDLEEFQEQILNAEIELARQYPDLEDNIAVFGEDGVKEFLTITSDDLKSNGKLVPMGVRHFERKKRAVANWQLMQQAVAQDPMILQHFGSVRLARVFEELMDLDMAKVVTPYVRIGEMAKAAKLQQAAQTQIENENAVDIGGEDEENVLQEDDIEQSEEAAGVAQLP